jgi:hypothetical protein
VKGGDAGTSSWRNESRNRREIMDSTLADVVTSKMT